MTAPPMRAEREYVESSAAYDEQPGVAAAQHQAEQRSGHRSDADQEDAPAPVAQRHRHDAESRDEQHDRGRQLAQRPAYRTLGNGLASRHRSPIGTHRWSVRPMYSLSGRMSRLSACCSMTWAVQPDIREMANTGVNRSVGMPSAW